MTATKQKMLDKIQKFNKRYKIGDVVQVKKDLIKGSDCFIDIITHEAVAMHTPILAVTWLKDKGMYDIDCVVTKLDNNNRII